MTEALKPEKNLSDEFSTFPIISRIAVYDNMRSIPRLIEIKSDSIMGFLDETPQKIYSLSHEMGGKIPYTIIKEVVENLIHASFNEIIITILSNGNQIIITDQGPGINDKEKIFLPGFTSATSTMKKYIRGVGSGLPIVKETIIFSGGSIDVTDNIKKGTVVSLKIEESKNNQVLQNTKLIASPSYNNDSTASTKMSAPQIEESGAADSFGNLRLSNRQNKILSLILELEETGPSRVAKELGFSLSTSYRELVFLENEKLLILTESGKRKLSPNGKNYLEYYSNNF
ncbi:MAG: ATP-binding protein [Actinobacteria bacterium]|nr:ATP-binding protein [Actinomycetota bacterium]